MFELTDVLKSSQSELTMQEWNRGAELLTGFSKDEASGKRLVQHFVAEEFSDSVQTMLTQGMNGQEITNYEFSLWTKSGLRKDILWSATARRDKSNGIMGVIGIGHDITELRCESKMLANYVRICGAAVWSLKGNAKTGVVTDSKTREIEHLISQQAQMDLCDPRMVLWRASFVSILKTMCEGQDFWMRRKGAQEGAPPPEKSERTEIVTTDFGYEFCFEAPNGSVKWYKVQGHLIQECTLGSQFEVTGSMQEVTSMLIDKVMGDRWQKWWSRMCHMVFDATLLVDTQEYRVLNAWGEEKVFGCKLQSHHPLLQLIKPEDTVSLKEAAVWASRATAPAGRCCRSRTGRLAAYVCLGLAEFTPASVLQKRRRAFEGKEALTLNHKPDAFEPFKKSRFHANSPAMKLPELSEEAKQLHGL
ncbi:unnamed protein product [Effrenium voratum]|nr:unnamed protein product [Effrenium voratum]